MQFSLKNGLGNLKNMKHTHFAILILCDIICLQFTHSPHIGPVELRKEKGSEGVTGWKNPQPEMPLWVHSLVSAQQWGTACRVPVSAVSLSPLPATLCPYSLKALLTVRYFERTYTCNFYYSIFSCSTLLVIFVVYLLMYLVYLSMYLN